ncbi:MULTISPECIES: arsenic resistance N-acetyltransferase ArsN2 [unclassified Pseudomonas]|nr:MULTISPECIES: arsenic resistance N-acetyltransferase ArsN2 [unclassified Pseudomonas]
MEIRKVGPSDLNHLRKSLSQAGLPDSDVSEPDRQFYRFEVDGKWVAYGGLEGTGSDLLLRSIVVCETYRGVGLGKAVLSELERYAVSQGAVRLHLLTQSATGFFTVNGYELLGRDEAPTAITQTVQFKHLCPASASYLRKSLNVPPCTE